MWKGKNIYNPPYCRKWSTPPVQKKCSKSISIFTLYVFCIKTNQTSLFRDENINIDIFPVLSAIVTKLLQQDLCNSQLPTLEERPFFKYGCPKKQLIIPTSCLHLSLASKGRVKEGQRHGCDTTANIWTNDQER